MGAGFLPAVIRNKTEEYLRNTMLFARFHHRCNQCFGVFDGRKHLLDEHFHHGSVIQFLLLHCEQECSLRFIGRADTLERFDVECAKQFSIELHQPIVTKENGTEHLREFCFREESSHAGKYEGAFGAAVTPFI